MGITEDEIRRQKVLDFIKGKNIFVDIPLPLKDTSNDKIKTPFMIGSRIIQLFALIALTDPKAKKRKIHNWLISSRLFDSLEEEEKNLFANERRAKAITKKALSWLRESLIVLAWAVLIIDELPFPSQELTLDDIFDKIPPVIPQDTFLQGLKLRDYEEIYFQSDLYYRLHWITSSFKDHETKWGIKLDHEVIFERRRALEWLTQNEAWWKITLDT